MNCKRIGLLFALIVATQCAFVTVSLCAPISYCELETSDCYKFKRWQRTVVHGNNSDLEEYCHHQPNVPGSAMSYTVIDSYSVDAALPSVFSSALDTWGGSGALIQRPNFRAGLDTASCYVWMPGRDLWQAAKLGDAGTIAVTSTYWSSTTGGGLYVGMWLHHDPPNIMLTDCQSHTCSTANKGDDMQSAVLHELGHWFGLSHCADVCNQQVMYKGLGYNEVKRVLGSYDSQGIVLLYNQPLASNLAAQFGPVGVFGDTAYAVTMDEHHSAAIKLRGYGTAADYPGNPVTVHALVPHGVAGGFAAYVIGAVGGYAYYDWVEQDSSGEITSTEPFAAGARPIGWPNLSSGIDDPSGGLENESISDPLPEGEFGIVSDADCADIVVYASADSLADPIYQQIVTDNPTAKVLKRLAPVFGSIANHSAQAARDAIHDVYNANVAWNAHCGTLFNPPCNRYYPTAPGPEYYLVGDIIAPQNINTMTFAADNVICPLQPCRSDELIYDFDADGIPEGPLSRVPAETVAEAVKAAVAARDFNTGAFVDAGNHLLTLAGDRTGSSISTRVDTVSAAYLGMGFNVWPSLRQDDIALTDITAREAAIASRINAGVRELFGYGGPTAVGFLPGRFDREPGFDVGRYSTKQRYVAWLPGCNMHANWQSKAVNNGYDPKVQRMMWNDGAKTALAASWSNMNGGWHGDYQDLVSAFVPERQMAQASVAKISVARLTWNIAKRMSQTRQNYSDINKSMATWGSYVIVNRPVHGSGGGGCPVAELETPDGWTAQNTILSRSETGTLVDDGLKLSAQASSTGGRYHVRLRESEQERTTLDAVALAVVDREPSARSYRTENGFVLGTRRAASRVWRASGEDLTLLVSGQSMDGAILEPGDTIYAAGAERPASKTMSTQSAGVATVATEDDSLFDMDSNIKDLPPDELRKSGMQTEGTADQRVLAGTGLLLQQESAPGVWSTVRRYYPRADFEEAVTSGVGPGTVRIVAIGRHRVRFVGRVTRSQATAVVPAILAPASAQHTRLGNVRAAVRAEGGSLTYLEPGDTLNLQFDVPPPAEGKVRDLFLLTRGVYTTLGLSGLNGSPGSVVAVQFSFDLGPARPNPSTGRVTFGYTLARSTRAVLRLYNVAGRLVRTVVQEQQEAGPHEAIWDGADENGARSPAGVYFYRLQADSWSSNRKLVVIER